MSAFNTLPLQEGQCLVCNNSLNDESQSLVGHGSHAIHQKCFVQLLRPDSLEIPCIFRNCSFRGNALDGQSLQQLVRRRVAPQLSPEPFAPSPNITFGNQVILAISEDIHELEQLLDQKQWLSYSQYAAAIINASDVQDGFQKIEMLLRYPKILGPSRLMTYDLSKAVRNAFNNKNLKCFIRLIPKDCEFLPVIQEIVEQGETEFLKIIWEKMIDKKVCVNSLIKRAKRNHHEDLIPILLS